MLVVFWIVGVLVIIKLYVKFTTGYCRSNVCLVGKTAIVTGANTGIGYQTAEDFAKRGARVILACRNEVKGQNAVEQIVKATDNKNVIFKQLNLASFKSIREFAEDINSTETRLDILVNNAGAGYSDTSTVTNGLPTIMLTNYFGPFLLTNLLLDLLKKTPYSRIVNVASLAAVLVRRFDVRKLNVYPEDMFFSYIEMYSQSKLCNILFTMELAERLKDTTVTTYSLHPGAVATELMRKIPYVIRIVVENFLNLFFKVPYEGAQTSIYCSVTKGIECHSGQHFHDCAVMYRYFTARDPKLPKLLWAETEKLAKTW